jgi:anti-sigma regulatory factor (Ser/Thr protein kinase)
MGGDWYDAFWIGGGRIAIAAGDVVGHGVAAAAAMAQLRTALRAYAIDGHAPSAVVERVNALIFDLGPPTMTTLAYVVLDPEQQELEAVVAGHPPPLVLPPGGEPAFLPLQGNVPLGTTPMVRYRSETHPFAAGSVLVLYTDGLVETRTAPIDDGLERLRALCRAPAADVEGLCARIVAELVPSEPRDDVVVAVARIPPVPPRLSGRWPADPHALARIRQELRRWLRVHGAVDVEAHDITIASQEACTNAVEHAYGPGLHSFSLEAECEDGRVRITVCDEGRWRPPRGTNRGRGLGIMRELMDRVDVRHGDDGTVVVLERRLGLARA